jgi:SAM-dependent methyltransferase
MPKINDFKYITGKNWLVGRSLLPFLEYYAKNINGVVLDLGCGESPFRDYFNQAKKYIRIDCYQVDAEVILGELLEIPLPDASVDVVFVSQALSDTAQIEKSLCEINRILKEGGQLLVFESMMYPEHDLPHDYFRIMPEGLRFMGENAGFSVHQLIYLGGLFTRFVLLWNTFLMGKLKSVKITAPLAISGIVLANIICFILDKLFPHPKLASDYICILEKLKLSENYEPNSKTFL